MAEDIDGKRLNIIFCQFSFQRNEYKILGDRKREKKMNCLKFEINDITESVGIEDEALTKIRKVVAYK